LTDGSKSIGRIEVEGHFIIPNRCVSVVLGDVTAAVTRGSKAKPGAMVKLGDLVYPGAFTLANTLTRRVFGTAFI
jgi:hypothetical protein